jgi:hypothetical protein
MPQPYWGWFALAVGLIGAIEWTEIKMGYLRRGLYDHVMFFATPVLYVAAAWWIFVAVPLEYAGHIRYFAADQCLSHRGADESSVRILYGGFRRSRLFFPHAPSTDQITLRCNDGAHVYGKSHYGDVTATDQFFQ